MIVAVPYADGVSLAAHHKAFTVEDLDTFPDDGLRYEIVDGALFVTPAPGIPHQVCLGRLFSLLVAAVPADLTVLVAPCDWVIAADTVLEPDLMVVRATDLTRTRLHATPVLAVEILSPSSRRSDRGTKRLAYQDAGLVNYWIVDPEPPGELTVFRLAAGGTYQETATVAGNEVYADEWLGVQVVPAALVL